ncbi:MAG: S41 family peptidase [Bdellovibrio sp.]
MSRLLAILLAVSSLLVFYHFIVQKSFINPYPIVCDLVSKKIYLDEPNLKKWKNICNSRSRLVNPYSRRPLIIQDISNVLGLLNVSHLEIYDSSEVKKIWQGENLETGIESEFVDSELVIFKIHPNSPSEKVGLKKGDIIKSINGEQPNPWEAQSISGTYIIERNSGENSFQLKTENINRTENVEFQKIGNNEGIIRIPSFRASFFEEKQMQELEKDLKDINRLVVDLRGNIGGNFVSGLKFLSLLICSPKEIGRMIRPRADNNLIAEMPDDLREETQLDIFRKYREVILKTYKTPSCYNGEVVVLVDSKTASVAEMVAEALKELRAAPLLGSPSRGQLLVGVWYPLPEVGPGVEISIPEAYYLSQNNRRIESEGVALDKILYYNIKEMQAGIDSWVKSALSSPSKIRRKKL